MVNQSSSQHNTGSYSLSFYTQFDGSAVTLATVAVSVCSTNVYGLKVSGYLMAVPDAGQSDTLSSNNIVSVYSDAQAPVAQFGIQSVNTWTPFSGIFTQNTSNMTFLGVGIRAYSPWNGTIYLDDVKVAAP